MGSLQFEGELDSFSEKQLDFVRNVLEKRGFTNNKVIFKPAGAAGDNYVATVMRISVIVEGGKDFKMIAKFAPTTEAVRLLMNTGILFNNEIVMYEQVLPKFVSLQKAANVPDEDIFKYASCYGCLAEEPNEVVLLEDLAELDLKMLDRLSYLNNDAVKLVFKNFAIFHSLSYALKKLEPETYDCFKAKLNDLWDTLDNNKDFETYMSQVEESAIEVLDDEGYKSTLRGIVGQMCELSKKMKVSDKDSKHLVIQQGDAWNNNILFKLQDDKIEDCVMIDYQVAKESNPVCDILYMVFSCTDHDTRSKYYLEWMDYYHDQLDKSLANFGMKASFVYPKDQLHADLKRYSNIFFSRSVMLNSILSRKPEEAKIIQDAIKDLDLATIEENRGMETLSEDTVHIYKARLEGLIHSYHQFSYL